MTLYPSIDEINKESGVDGFRLQQISELEFRLQKERDTRISMYKKYNRAVNALDVVNAVLMVATIGLGGTGIGLLSTIVAAPAVVIMEGAALVSGVTGLILKFITTKLKKKVLKHDEIRVLADSKLNTISDHISAALTDGKISEEEFKLVLSEFDKFNKMKHDIQIKSRKESGISEAQKKEFMEKGRQQAQAIFRDKAMALTKD